PGRLPDAGPDRLPGMARAGRARAGARRRARPDRARRRRPAPDRGGMNLLGFDTSTPAVAVCVLRADGAAFEAEPPVARLAEPPEEAPARGPAATLAAGAGSIRFREAREDAGIRVAPAGSRMHVVRGLHICKLAATVPPAPPESVVPCYLRAPDAKPPSRSGA